MFEVPDPGADSFDIVCTATKSRPAPSVTWFVGESHDFCHVIFLIAQARPGANQGSLDLCLFSLLKKQHLKPLFYSYLSIPILRRQTETFSAAAV